jgi:hypothetical protein
MRDRLEDTEEKEKGKGKKAIHVKGKWQSWKKGKR